MRVYARTSPNSKVSSPVLAPVEANLETALTGLAARVTCDSVSVRFSVSAFASVRVRVGGEGDL